VQKEETNGLDAIIGHCTKEKEEMCGLSKKKRRTVTCCLDFGKLGYIRLYKEAAQQVLFIHVFRRITLWHHSRFGKKRGS
jgi:hypothetical protein